MDNGPRPGAAIRGDIVLHPACLASLALLLLNDHVLKDAFPGVVTGKLSDFAGLMFFPCLLIALHDVIRRRPPSARVAVVAVVATGLVFALVKTWEPAADLYRVGLGVLQWPFRALGAVARGVDAPALAPVHLVKDPTDLVALPALLVPLWIARRRARTPAA